MISCTEFIPAYSEGFKYLELKGGRQEVEKFWKKLSEGTLVNTLSKAIQKEGIKGCFTYWSHTLNEEAADFRMTLDEAKGEFRIDMFKCPSKGMLNELKYMEPYHAYCEHCPALYKPIVESHGLTYEEDMSRCDEARCSIVIRRKLKT